MMNETTPDPVQPAPEQSATPDQATSAPSSTLGDLESLLAEYDSATAKPEAKGVPQQPVAPPQAPQPAGYDFDREMEKLNADLRAAGLEKQVTALNSEVDLARHYIDQQHFDAAVSAIEKRLADSELVAPPNYVKTALMAAAHDPAVVKAFDERGHDPKAYARIMKKLQDKILADVKSQPDADVTADRAAVVAALRWASTDKALEAPPPKLGSLSDKELDKEWEKLGG